MIEHLPAFILPIALVALGGLFSAVDSALITVSAARAEQLVRDGRPGARRVVRVVADKARYVNLMVLLRISCEVSATVLLADALLDLMSEGYALLTAAAVMTLAAYIVIGVGPRTLGRQHAYSIILVAAWPLPIMATLLGPLTRLLILLGNAITPGKGFRNGPFATEIELREIVDMAQERGVLAADEGRMIQSVFELGDTSARGVMVPRPEMVWIEADKTIAQAASLAVRSGHSRIPVIGENVDDVVGVVYLRDLVGHLSSGRGAMQVANVMREPIFVPDSKPLDTLLAEMQRDRNHMALLVDEYGGIAGLVTIEDVLEEIVGEIADEYDSEEIAPIEDLGNGKYRVSARLRLEELGEVFGMEIEDEEVETVGGLLGHQLGRVPLPGSKVVSHGLVLRGEGSADDRGRMRVQTVLVKRVQKPKEPDQESPKKNGERKKDNGDDPR